MTLRRAALLMLLLPLLAACAGRPLREQPPLTPGPPIDLARYMGDWYVIAHIPYWLERDKVATLDRYALRPDGRIDNRFVFRERLDGPEREWRGVATVVPGSGNAHWTVQFVWPLRTDLYVLAVDPEYRWALVGHPSRRYGWVFAREPHLDPATYAVLLDRFAALGFDPAAFARVPQRP